MYINKQEKKIFAYKSEATAIINQLSNTTYFNFERLK